MSLTLSLLDQPDPLPRIEGDGVALVRPQLGRYEEWAALREASRAFIQPWEPTWPPDDLSRAAYRRRLRRYAQDVRAQFALPYFIIRAEDDALVGGVTVSHIRRGVAQTASVGYWCGAPYTRNGYTHKALQALIPRLLRDFGLHRLEAACQPNNAPSRALLEKLGFVEEGFARSYLKINGAWRDHVLYGLLESDWCAWPGTTPAETANSHTP